MRTGGATRLWMRVTLPPNPSAISLSAARRRDWDSWVKSPFPTELNPMASRPLVIPLLHVGSERRNVCCELKSVPCQPLTRARFYVAPRNYCCERRQASSLMPAIPKCQEDRDQNVLLPWQSRRWKPACSTPPWQRATGRTGWDGRPVKNFQCGNLSAALITVPSSLDKKMLVTCGNQIVEGRKWAMRGLLPHQMDGRAGGT